ncbi:MAG: branched-chain amino acid transaminase [Deltaproteobacteria bacterium]|jgi:branched-chain amino acid aminotransferase|nr:branched-chain amino acid transaminase [Deltaproteobacteria bacterium]MBT4525496.1 branched-chain amino acid transaminase [Deltaproteobacteria bacterium]
MGIPQVKSIWMNGKLTPWQDAKVHVLSHSLHYGSGVFEGIRCYNTINGPAVFRLREHIERLFFSAKIHRIKIPYTIEEIESAIFETIKENKLEACYIRPLVIFGMDSLGVHPGSCPIEVSIATWPWAAYLGEEALQNGIRATISSWRKFHSSMMPTSAKATGQYLNSVLAVSDAVSKGYDEAILLNMNGEVAEGSGENLFLVKNNTIITNPENDSILNGITRHSSIQIIKHLGLDIQERSIGVPELFCADELFFTGTAAEVTPIREVDHRIISQGKMGPITQKIQKLFFDVVNGRNEDFKNWLTYLET